MTIQIIPSDKDVPQYDDVQEPSDKREIADAAFKTAQTLEAEGVDTQPTDADRRESRAIFTDSPVAPLVPSTSAAAYHLKALLNEYDHQVLDSNIQARNYIVNRFLDISNPHPRIIVRPNGEQVEEAPAKIPEQLKALELLGKVSEIGLFTERIEVSITNKSTEEIERELVQTMVKYMGEAEKIPEAKSSLVMGDLDAELGRDSLKNDEKGDENDNT